MTNKEITKCNHCGSYEGTIPHCPDNDASYSWSDILHMEEVCVSCGEVQQ